jgi:hypothetical protein
MRNMKSLFCFLIVSLMMPSAMFSQSVNKLTAKEKKEGWVLLFDGVDLNGWVTPAGTPPPTGWDIKNGILTKTAGKHGDIRSVNEYSDFELVADYNITSGGNSGIKYFYHKYDKGGNLGMEYQILDDKLAEDNKYPTHLLGSFYDVMIPNESIKKANPPGEWNSIRIVSKGKHVEHWLNGVKILEFERGSQAFNEGVAKSKFSKAEPAFGMLEKGYILLTDHESVCSFRNIKLRVL